ncbi:MAG: GntR family transcriptional regulator [Gemmatimonadetes bacterium]|nr:GntR family transcriptional regulator [Gemmatimonadota bacterium]
MAATSNVARSEYVNQAYERLRDMIVDGRLAPGSPSIETEVAALPGLSRTHVQAAPPRLLALHRTVKPQAERFARITAVAGERGRL